MKKFLFILLIIFISGILSADICLKQIQEGEAVLNLSLLEQYATAKLVFKDVFWNVLYERTKLFGILILLCFTPSKEKLGIILAPVFCFIWGFFLMSCIMELGAAGVVVGLATVFPHGILYCSIAIFLFSKQQQRGYYKKNPFVVNMGKYMLLILLFVTACVMESLVSTHFIPWVIRLSLI